MQTRRRRSTVPSAALASSSSSWALWVKTKFTPVQWVRVDPDSPCPTVTAGGVGGVSDYYIEERRVQTRTKKKPLDALETEPHIAVRQRNKTGGRERYSLDEPAPSVTAGDMGSAAAHQVAIVIPDPHLEVRSANEVRDVRMRVELDAPAKCITVNGMGGGNRAQTSLVDVPPDPGADASTRVDGFRLPSMADVARARGSTGLRVVSTFSGCGGSCLGLEMAGFDVRYASEFVAAARETYVLNHAEHVHVDPRDIRAVKAEEILAKLGIAKGELDLFEGSPPCASFSTAGNRDKDWGKTKSYSDTKQRTDDLFFEWARLLEGLMPRAFVAENVSGLVKGKAFGYFKAILERLEGTGYVVGAKVLDAQWLGVPQQRQRLFFVGVRKDLAAQLGIKNGREVPYPKPLRRYYSMRDALPHLRSVVHDTSGTFGQGEVIDKPSPAITVGVNSVNSYHFKAAGPEPRDDVRQAPWDEDADHPVNADPANFAEPDKPFAGDARLYVRDGFRAGTTIGVDEPAPTVMAAGMGGVHRSQMLLEEPRIDPTPEELAEATSKVTGYAIDRQYDKTPQGTWNRKYFNLFKPHPDRPLPTVTAIGGGAGVASVVHPFERRKFTIRELKRPLRVPR